MKHTLISILFVVSAAGYAAGATYTVTNTNDSGAGSLRSALWTADATAADDVIVFDIQGCPNNVCTIVLTSGQLTIRAASTVGKLAIINAGGPGSLVISGNNSTVIFFAQANSNLSIEGITIEKGTAGIWVQYWGGELRVSNSVIRRCNGSGIAGYGTITVEDSEISENMSTVGGGIQFYGYELFIERSEIKQNTAVLGGGIRLHGDGAITVRDSTIADNVAQEYGGAIDIFPDYGGGALLENSTVSGNHAGDFGGGFSATGGGKYGYTGIKLTNSTLTGNSAQVGGGIAGFCSVATRNSIIAGNSATQFPDIYPYLATVYDLGNNILAGGPTLLLGPLAHNGGRTRTHALLPGSPAINAGNSCVLAENGCGDGNSALVLDQRGSNRVGNVDIGAFERTPSRTRFDFDADGRSDVSVFRPSNSVWYLNRSTGGFFATQFGLPTDTSVPADYDGDGKSDIAVYRNGTWWVMKSSTMAVEAVQFGQAGDLPVPADYTGDGREELAVYRNGEWWMLEFENRQASLVNFGAATDKPVPGDYDGDGLIDQAVYRNGEWHLNRSSLGYTVVSFGLPSDTPVVGDYDGDGRTDLAVFRDGTWYLQQSTAEFLTFQWGLSTDTPAPADYDGDGKADATVYRDGDWYQLKSTGGISIEHFGLTGDRPLAASFIR
jgi:hypothetical protein